MVLVSWVFDLPALCTGFILAHCVLVPVNQPVKLHVKAKKVDIIWEGLSKGYFIYLLPTVGILFILLLVMFPLVLVLTVFEPTMNDSFSICNHLGTIRSFSLHQRQGQFCFHDRLRQSKTEWMPNS